MYRDPFFIRIMKALLDLSNNSSLKEEPWFTEKGRKDLLSACGRCQISVCLEKRKQVAFVNTC